MISDGNARPPFELLREADRVGGKWVFPKNRQPACRGRTLVDIKHVEQAVEYSESRCRVLYGLPHPTHIAAYLTSYVITSASARDPLETGSGHVRRDGKEAVRLAGSRSAATTRCGGQRPPMGPALAEPGVRRQDEFPASSCTRTT